MRTRVVRGQLASGTVSKSNSNSRLSREVSLISSGLKRTQDIFWEDCSGKLENSNLFPFMKDSAEMDCTSIVGQKILKVTFCNETDGYE